MTMQGVSRRILLAGAGGLIAAPAIVRAQGSNGVALVIGNSKYKWEASLPNVKRDAPDVAKRFQALGLKTELLENVGQEAMKQALENLRSTSRGANFAAFYFAGHGVSWAGDTYVVPADADLSSSSAVRNLIAASAVKAIMGEAKHRLLVFDSCRNNPADGWRQLDAERQANVSRESLRDDAAQAPNTLALFSTAPGRAAVDGPAGENSPFASTLLNQLDGQSIDFQALPAKLRRELLIATQGRQVVWDQNTYREPFLLSGARGSAGPSAGKSRRGGDPSGIIEVPNAYVAAQSAGLLLPAGLVAQRPPTASRDSQKVGSFSFTAQTMNSPAPRVLVVLSVVEQQSAQIVQAGFARQGAIWRFVNARLSGDSLDYTARSGGEHFTFTWSDANSGRLTQNPDASDSGRVQIFNATFKRLDG